jgi:hypothetical protein
MEELLDIEHSKEEREDFAGYKISPTMIFYPKMKAR